METTHGKTLLHQSRRTFCLNACQAASLIAVGAVLESCGGGGGGNPVGGGGSVTSLPTVSGTVIAANTLTVAVDSGPLAVVGGAAFVTSSAGNVLVARTGQDTFSALSSICTHENCNVSAWSSPMFVCPCHGSEYATDGTVVRGPAARSLTKFGTSVANNILTISA